MDIAHFIYSSVHGHLGYLYFLATWIPFYTSWIFKHVAVFILFIQNQYVSLQNKLTVTSLEGAFLALLWKQDFPELPI